MARSREEARAYNRQYYLKNREKALAERKKYYEQNREKCIAETRARTRNKPEAISKNKKEYYRKNREAILEYKEQYYQENLEEMQERHRASYKKHRKKKLEKYRTPEGRLSALIKGAKARAKRAGLPFDLEVGDLTIPELCPLLEIPIELDVEGKTQPNSPSLDRIVPDLGYVKGNVRVISYKANTMKTNATPEMLSTFAKNVPSYLGSLEVKP